MVIVDWLFCVSWAKPSARGVDFSFSIRFRFGPHPLYRAHHVGLLSEKRVPEIGGPAYILIQPGNHVWKHDQRLNAGIPVLQPRALQKLLPSKAAVLLEPLLSLNDLERVSGCGQDLAQ